MRWIALIALIFAMIIGGGFFASHLAESRTVGILQKAGFTTPIYKDAQKGLGGVTLKNISLDPDNISTIDTIIGSYDMGGAATLFVNKLDLTGDTENGINISGFKNEGFPYSLNDLDLKTLIFNDSKLSFLTEYFGGFSVSFEGKLTRADSGLNAQLRFSSSQKQFSVDGQATGGINSDTWTIEGEIEQAKFDLDALAVKITRGHGQFSAQGAKNAPLKGTMQVNAGGFQLLGLPWTGASITFDMLGERKKITLDAHSLSDQMPIELSLTWDKNGNAPANTNATIFSPHMEDLTTYLEKNKKTKLAAALQSIPGELQDVTLIIGHTQGQTVLIAIKSYEDHIRTFEMPAADFL